LIKGRLEMPQRRNYDGFGVIRLSVDDISDREDIAFLGGIRDAEAFRIHQVGARIDLSQSRLLGFRRIEPTSDERDLEFHIGR